MLHAAHLCQRNVIRRVYFRRPRKEHKHEKCYQVVAHGAAHAQARYEFRGLAAVQLPQFLMSDCRRLTRTQLAILRPKNRLPLLKPAATLR